MSQGLYRGVFLIGVLGIVAGVALGTWQSLSTEQRLPVLSLTDVIDTYLERIDLLVRDGEYEAAQEQLELALRLLHRDEHLARNVMGRALLGQGRPQEAAEQLRQAVVIAPEFAEARNNLAVAYARLGDLDRALAEVREALRIDPDLEEARQNLQRMEAASGPATAEDEGDGPLVRGRTAVLRFYRGELEELHSSFAPAFASRMSLEDLREMRRTLGRQLGRETSLVDEGLARAGSSLLYNRRSRFEAHTGEVEIVVQLDGEAVGGILFRPVSAND